MKKVKFSLVPLAIILFSIFGILSASQIRTTSIEQGVNEVKVQNGEVSVRTRENKQINLSEAQLGQAITVKSDLPDFEPPEEPDIDQEPLEDTLEPGKETIDEIVQVLSNIDIVVEENQVVKGDVVSVLAGNVIVKGKVLGTVAVIGRKLHVTPTGRIEGDVVIVGGTIIREPGAVIKGHTTGIVMAELTRMKRDDVISFHRMISLGSIIVIVISLFVAVMVFAIAPKNIQKIRSKIDLNFWISFLTGFAVWLLIAPVFLILFVLLCITIIGIPVAVIALPLATVVYLLLAYTGGCYFVGDKIKAKTPLKPETPMMTLIVGVLTVEVIFLLARLIGIAGGILDVFGWIVAILGWVILGVAMTVGLGATLLTLFGTRPKDAKVEEKRTESGGSPAAAS